MNGAWKNNIYLCELAVYAWTLFLGLPFYLFYLMFMEIFDRNTRFMGAIATGVMSAGAIPLVLVPGEIVRMIAYRVHYAGNEEVDTIVCGVLAPKKSRYALPKCLEQRENTDEA